MTSPYSPPAELVERVARAMWQAERDHADEIAANAGPSYICVFPLHWESCNEIYRFRARACLAASGLGEVVEVLREIVDEGGVVRIGRMDDIRALLARLDTRT